MFPCEFKHEAQRPTLSIRFRAPVSELAAHFGEVYGAIIGYLAERGQTPPGPAFATYYNMDMDALDVEAGFPVAEPVPGHGRIEAHGLPEGTYAVCHYVGPYDGVSVAYDELTTFVAANGYIPSGIAYEWYYDGPETPPDKARTDVAFPVTLAGVNTPQP